MENDFDLRIHAYLNQEMTPAEQQAFETALQADPDLQKAFDAQQNLEKTLNAYGSWRLHKIAGEMREKLGPLPEPKVSWFDRLRFSTGWFRSGNLNPSFGTGWFERMGRYPQVHPWRTALAAGSLILTGLLVYANFALEPPSDLPAHADYRAEPKTLEVAGGSPRAMAPEKEDFEKSARFYWSKPIQADSLIKQIALHQPFSMAEYYLAHWDLGNERYERAASGFQHCLEHSAHILLFKEMQQEIPRIRLNLILAQLGAGQRPAEVLPEIEALIHETAPEKDVHKKASALRRELKNPLRFLRINF